MHPPADPITTLRALLAEATPGPWKTSREDMDSYVSDERGNLVPVAYVYRKPEERIGVLGDRFRHDSRLIAAMRNALPALLDRLAAAEAVVEAARCWCGADGCHPGTQEYHRHMHERTWTALAAYDRAIGETP